MRWNEITDLESWGAASQHAKWETPSTFLASAPTGALEYISRIHGTS